MSATDQPDFLADLSALIARHQEQAATQPEAPALMTARDVIRETQLSEAQVYLLMRRGEIPGVIRIGKSVRVNRAVFEAWLAEQSQPEPVPFRRAG